MALRQKNMVLLVMAGFLCVAALLNGAEAACGGFAASCTAPFLFEGSILSANCPNYAGNFSTASIDLNPHLSNNNGNLVQGSGFAVSCSSNGYGMISQQFYVFANCHKEDGSSVDTSYNAQNNVVNDNGVLTWNNCPRRALLESRPVDLGGRKLLK